MTQPRVVGSRYELGELIGYGGMAEVHRGRDTRLNRDVAIKVLRADLARDPSFLNRFRREAHSAAGLNHPSIVSVYDTGEDVAADGTAIPFIVMEYVEGRTLRDILKTEGRLPVRRSMEIIADVCAALDFSHRNGIIHRDIKPANVMITPQGAVKVMDFGIARAVADSSATVTQTANVIGTAQYLSPEQARGESVDPRSDVYSCGCLLYELVTGVPPFQGDSPVAVAYQHVRENPLPPSARNPELPRTVDSIVMKALAKNPLNRYQSAGDMRADLQRALANQPVTAEAVMTDAERTQFISRPPAPGVAVRRGPYPDDERDERRTGLIWAAVVIALLLVIGIATFIILGGGSGGGGKKTVVLKSVAGMLPQPAKDAIKAQGLTPKQGPASSGPCEGGVTDKGKVCLTRPTPGTAVPVGSTITFQLYSPKLVSVPFVEGKTFAQAIAVLHHDGLMWKRLNRHNPAPAGQVIRQGTQEYTNVAPGTPIKLFVSTGTVMLPGVRKMDLTDARAKLDAAGFHNVSVLTQTEETDPNQDGIVFEETPTPRLAYPVSQKVTLTVYQYVAPPPPTSSTPTSPSSSSSSSSPSTSPSTSPSRSP